MRPIEVPVYLFAAASLLTACGSASPSSPETASAEAARIHTQAGLTAAATVEPGLSVKLSPGELLTVAVSRHRDGAEPRMQQYFKAVMPIAAPLGFGPRGALDVVSARAGAFEPNNFVGFYSFPDGEAARRFAADPRWPAIRATRPEIWSELRISHFEVKAETEWVFRSDRLYEVRYEWGVLAHAESGIKAGGGRVMAHLAQGQHEMLPASLGQPVAIRLIEWPDLKTAEAASRPQTAIRVDSLYTRPHQG